MALNEYFRFEECIIFGAQAQAQARWELNDSLFLSVIRSRSMVRSRSVVRSGLISGSWMIRSGFVSGSWMIRSRSWVISRSVFGSMIRDNLTLITHISDVSVFVISGVSDNL